MHAQSHTFASCILKNYLLREGIVRFVSAGNLAGAAFEENGHFTILLNTQIYPGYNH